MGFDDDDMESVESAPKLSTPKKRGRPSKHLSPQTIEPDTKPRRGRPSKGSEPSSARASSMMKPQSKKPDALPIRGRSTKLGRLNKAETHRSPSATNPFGSISKEKVQAKKTLIATPSKFAIIMKTPKAPNKKNSRNDKARAFPALSPRKTRHLSNIFKSEAAKDKLQKEALKAAAPKQSSISKKLSNIAKALEKTSESPAPEKRGRGRPRKTDVPLKAASKTISKEEKKKQVLKAL